MCKMEDRPQITKKLSNINQEDVNTKDGVATEAVEHTLVIQDKAMIQTPSVQISDNKSIADKPSISNTTVTLDDLLREEISIVSDQESTSATTDQGITSSPAVNHDSNSSENDFPSALLLSENPARSDNDYDMLEDLTGVLNEDRTNGANLDSLERAIIYELMQNNSTIITQEDTQFASSPMTFETQTTIINYT